MRRAVPNLEDIESAPFKVKKVENELICKLRDLSFRYDTSKMSLIQFSVGKVALNFISTKPVFYYPDETNASDDYTFNKYEVVDGGLHIHYGNEQVQVTEHFKIAVSPFLGLIRWFRVESTKPINMMNLPVWFNINGAIRRYISHRVEYCWHNPRYVWHRHKYTSSSNQFGFGPGQALYMDQGYLMIPCNSVYDPDSGYTFFVINESWKKGWRIFNADHHFIPEEYVLFDYKFSMDDYETFESPKQYLLLYRGDEFNVYRWVVPRVENEYYNTYVFKHQIFGPGVWAVKPWRWEMVRFKGRRRILKVTMKDLRKLADELLPIYASLNYKWVGLDPVWVCETEGLYPTGFSINPEIGERNIKYFIEKAHKLGLEVLVWFPFYGVLPSERIKKHALWAEDYEAEHPEWIARSLDGKKKTVYGGKIVMSLYSGWQEELIRKAAEYKKKLGFDGIFVTPDFDSHGRGWHNMNDYSEAGWGRNHHTCSWETYAKLADLGLKILIEDTTFRWCGNVEDPLPPKDLRFYCLPNYIVGYQGVSSCGGSGYFTHFVSRLTPWEHYKGPRGLSVIPELNLFADYVKDADHCYDHGYCEYIKDGDVIGIDNIGTVFGPVTTDRPVFGIFYTGRGNVLTAKSVTNLYRYLHDYSDPIQVHTLDDPSRVKPLPLRQIIDPNQPSSYHVKIPQDWDPKNRAAIFTTLPMLLKPTRRIYITKVAYSPESVKLHVESMERGCEVEFTMWDGEFSIQMDQQYRVKRGEEVKMIKSEKALMFTLSLDYQNDIEITLST